MTTAGSAAAAAVPERAFAGKTGGTVQVRLAPRAARSASSLARGGSVPRASWCWMAGLAARGGVAWRMGNRTPRGVAKRRRQQRMVGEGCERGRVHKWEKRPKCLRRRRKGWVVTGTQQRRYTRHSAGQAARMGVRTATGHSCRSLHLRSPLPIYRPPSMPALIWTIWTPGRTPRQQPCPFCLGGHAGLPLGGLACRCLRAGQPARKCSGR